MRQINVHDVALDARFNRFHFLILFLCTVVIVADGYDMLIVGIALPMIVNDMGVTPTQAGIMASASVFGMMLGALLIGSVADSVGRRRAMMTCLAVFSAGTAAAGLTHDAVSFSVIRFIAGLGIGGVMPCVITQMTEFSPRSTRATMVTASFSGFAMGGIAAALTGKALVETYGWRSVFFTAALALLLIPLITRLMPESMAFLVKRGRLDELRVLLRRINPSVSVGAVDALVCASEIRAGEGIGGRSGQLFSEGRTQATCMFWVASFMCLFMIFALGTWLVKLMANAGYSLGSAMTFALVLNIGALIGSICVGRLGDRFPIRWVLVGLYLLAAFGIIMLSNKFSQPLLYLFTAIVGAATYGGQVLTFAYAAQFYPFALRGIGVGWITAVSRVGAIIAPIFLGFLITLKLPLEQDFIAVAIPAFIAAVAVSQIRLQRISKDSSVTCSTHDTSERYAP